MSANFKAAVVVDGVDVKVGLADNNDIYLSVDGYEPVDLSIESTNLLIAMLMAAVAEAEVKTDV